MAGNLEYEKVPKVFFKVVRIFLVASLNFCFTFFFVLIPRTFEDVSETAVAFGLGTTAFLSLVKAHTFYWSKQKFYDLMQQVEDFGEEGL